MRTTTIKVSAGEVDLLIQALLGLDLTIHDKEMVERLEKRLDRAYDRAS